jgi:asparagine N-glycosylation enzyme membrane subunit Stt3
LAYWQVEASIKLKTNQGREFIYKNTGITDKAGNFEIIVPYTGEYKLKIGNYETIYNNPGI